MGKPKLGMELESGVPLGSLGLRTLLDSEIEEVIAVVGPGELPSWLRETADAVGRHAKLRVVVCTNSEKGMSQSIKSGINAARSSRMDAVLVGLADQPFVTAEMVRRLILALEERPELDYAASSSEGVLMPPAIFRLSMLPALAALEGDTGARKLFGQDGYRGQAITYDGNESEGGLLLDVDDLKDFQIAIERYRSNK
ncbi:nucleotidyltransferase family protein [Paenibacillus radicis (ex Gao et al. 2016)]|uniref:Xanthine dehydrogenase accessory protein PucB n=1 Tax=Paenibacillus radicis (ex Gao et al. 2016) TaxID=1737354 RepID=A0A917HHR2_9BACL|nr:NTP transferase domain-containing protein [Paenibacillus radicis (ex Gao et al. 2016)]GGG79711.1 xanthine dehydrogenase accessory protein PucB [Paenibacillus radicis (ex Gao et al. 2016)]